MYTFSNPQAFPPKIKEDKVSSAAISFGALRVNGQPFVFQLFQYCRKGGFCSQQVVAPMLFSRKVAKSAVKATLFFSTVSRPAIGQWVES